MTKIKYSTRYPPEHIIVHMPKYHVKKYRYCIMQLIDKKIYTDFLLNESRVQKYAEQCGKTFVY